MTAVWQRPLSLLARDRAGLAALAVIAVYVAVALGCAWGWWATGWDLLLNDGGYGPITGRYWLGSNFNGQDIWQRALYSTKTAFEVGLSAAICAMVIGAISGAIAGFYGGSWIDAVIGWAYTCIDAMPFYLLVAAIAFALREAWLTIHVAMAATFWTPTCKVIRGETMRLRHQDFVTASQAIGLSDIGLIGRHILPNVVPLLLVEGNLAFATAIKTEAILSFLGLGIKDGVSWGTMLAEASSEVLAGRYHNLFAASIFLFILVFALNQLADSLQDALDPRTRWR